MCGPGLARPADHNSQCNSLHTALLATLSVGRDSSRCLLVTRLQTQILVCCKLWQQRALCLLCSWPRLQPRLTLQPPVSLSLSLSALWPGPHTLDPALQIWRACCSHHYTAAWPELRVNWVSVIITMVTWSDITTPAPTPVVTSAIILRLNVSVECWW